MPSSAEITRRLAEAAGDWIALAIGWHLVIAACLVALASGWRPHHRTSGLLLASLCASVSAVAWLAGNPFNGAVFAALTAAFAVTALRLPPAAAGSRAPRWARIAGAAMLAFGLVYPHFLAGPPALYLLAAPVGIVPCPSLAVVIGFTLLAGGLGSRAWCGWLLAAGGFYSVFGVWRLGVVLDVGLLAGTIAVAFLLSRRAVEDPRDQQGRPRAALPGGPVEVAEHHST